MSRPFELVLSEEEKRDLQTIAMAKGVSVSELVSHALYKALENDATGVYDGMDELAGDE